MANYTINKFTYGGNTYILQDANASTTDNKVGLTADSSTGYLPLTFKKGTTSPAGLYYNDNIKVKPSTGEINATAAKFGTLGADNGIFNKLVATNAEIDSLDVSNLTATNATVVGLLDVQGDMHTNSWTNANIANIGGSFYITPTVESQLSGSSYITITVSGTSGNRTIVISAPSGSFVTDAVKIYNNGTTSTATWSVGSKVMMTGSIRSNTSGVDYPLGTCKGTLSAALATTGFTIQGVNEPVLESILTELGTSNLKSQNIKLSMYEIGPAASSKPVGILLTSYGVDKSTYIDIYGGVNVKNSSTNYTEPNVRIGYLGGIPAYTDTLGNSHKPTGWGIYTNNGYFKGVVVADAGVIGGFKIDSDIHSGTLGANNSVWMSTGTTGSAAIGGSQSIANWAFTAGQNFGVTTDGTIYATGAQISGPIQVTAGSNAYTSDDVNPLEIGGRNLIISADCTIGSILNSSGGIVNNTRGVVSDLIEVSPNTNYILQYWLPAGLSDTGNNRAWNCTILWYRSEDIVEEESASEIYVSGYDAEYILSDYMVYSKKSPSNASYCRICLQFPASYNEGIIPSNWMNGQDEYRWKLEQGTIATDWTLAPEDTNNLATQQDYYLLTDNGINPENANYYYINENNQLVSKAAEWTTLYQSPDEYNPYVWWKYVQTYSSGQVYESIPVIFNSNPQSQIDELNSVIGSQKSSIASLQESNVAITNKQIDLTTSIKNINDTLNDYKKGITMNSNIPMIKVYTQEEIVVSGQTKIEESSVNVYSDKVVIQGSGNSTTEINSESFKTNKIIATTLMPRAESIGQLAFLARQNGHFSLKVVQGM